MKKLKSKTLRIEDLSVETRQDMYDLYDRYYEGTDKDIFLSDLDKKDWALLLLDQDDVLRGFTTIEMMDFVFKENRATAIYSGDTVIHHDFWGEQTLPLAWCSFAGELKSQHPDTPLYWFLIVKGHRTYRYLNAFFKSYYPNRRSETPERLQKLMNYLAEQKFGELYSPDTGLISYPEPCGNLKPEWQDCEKQRSPEAQYFLTRNPTYTQGTDLMCLTEISEDQMKSFALRGFQEGVKRAENLG